jgi:hypothetical protein
MQDMDIKTRILEKLEGMRLVQLPREDEVTECRQEEIQSGLMAGVGRFTTTSFIDKRGAKLFKLSPMLFVIGLPFPLAPGSTFRFLTCFSFFSVTCKIKFPQ